MNDNFRKKLEGCVGSGKCSEEDHVLSESFSDLFMKALSPNFHSFSLECSFIALVIMQ